MTYRATEKLPEQITINRTIVYPVKVTVDDWNPGMRVQREHVKPDEENSVKKFLSSDNKHYWWMSSYPSCDIEEVTNGGGKIPVQEYVALKDQAGNVLCKLRNDEFKFLQHVIRGYSTNILFPMLFHLSKDKHLTEEDVEYCEKNGILKYAAHMTDGEGFFVQDILEVGYTYPIVVNFKTLKEYFDTYNPNGEILFVNNGGTHLMTKNPPLGEDTSCENITFYFNITNEDLMMRKSRTRRAGVAVNIVEEFQGLSEPPYAEKTFQADELNKLHEYLHGWGFSPSNVIASPMGFTAWALTQRNYYDLPDYESIYVTRHDENKCICQVQDQGSGEWTRMDLVPRTSENS